MSGTNEHGPARTNAAERQSPERPGRTGTRARALAVVTVAILAVTTVVLAPPAQAAPSTRAADPVLDPSTPTADAAGSPDPEAATQGLPPECVTTNDSSGRPVSTTCTYGPKGSAYQFFRPPAEVKTVSVVAYGAQGGSSASAGGGTPGVGGLGGRMDATIDVSGGRTLVLLVGNQGGSQRVGGNAGMGGWPGGGDGGYSTASSAAGCGGGGSTRIDDATTSLLEAAGGGGCGGYFTPMTGANGGSGGVFATGGGTGQSAGIFCNTANGYAGTGGGPATLGAGGAKGVQGQYIASNLICYGGSSASANPGSKSMGGNGADGEGNPIRGTGGGGGGGGSYGGGGGGGGQQNTGDGSGGGGGGGGGAGGWGGSGVTLTGYSDGVRSGNGALTISWNYVPTSVSVSATDWYGAPVTSIKAGDTVKFVATLTSSSAVTGHTGGVTFTDALTGIPLCEGTPQTPVLSVQNPAVTSSTATCTFSGRNTTPPPPQCVAQPPSDPPPPPLPAECSFTTNTARPLAVTAHYSPGIATSEAVSPSPFSFTIAPGEVVARVIGSTEPNTVRIVVGPHFAYVPIDGTVTLYYEDETPVEGCVDREMVYTPADYSALVSCYVPLVPGSTRTLHVFYTGGPNTESVRNFDYYDFVITAAKIPTTTGLSLVDGTRTYGHPLTASAVVALNPSTPGVSIDGTVTFTDAVDGGARAEVPGCTALAVPAAGNGRVDCTIARPVVGTHRLQAEYGAGNQTEGSASTEQAATITTATPRATLSADPPGGSTAGQFVTLTGRVELSDGTSDHVAVLEGTATFRDQGVDIPGCVDLPVGQPTVTCSLQPAITTGGPAHSFTVHHLGSANLAPASSSALSYAVGLAATSTSLALVPPSTSPAPAGTAVTVAATVTAGVAGVIPTGNVAFFDNGQPIAGCPPPRPVDGGGQATCTFVPSAGTSHALTASFQPIAGGTTAASSTTSPLALAVGRFASGTTVAVTPPSTPTTPAVGDEVVITAAVATSATGPIPTGTVSFRDGAATIAGCGSVALAPVPGSSPPAAGASCTIEPGGGSHSFRAVYSGDVPTGPSTSSAVAYVVHAAGTTTSVSATPTGATELTLAATVAPVTGSAIPTGTVDLAVDGDAAAGACQAVPLVATSGGATASCTWTGDPTAEHLIDATYTPAGADFTASTGSFTFAASVACRAGEVALWAELDDTPGGVTVNDGHSRLTLSMPDGPGPCGAVPVPVTATSVSLFGGLLTGHGSGVLTGAAANGSFCLTEGSFDAPAWMSVPTLDVSAPVCWLLEDDGTLGASTRGELAAQGPEGQFPFVGLDDTPATTASFTFTPGGPDGASELQLRFVAGPADEPVLDLELTVAADGAFAGSLDTPGLVLFGQSLSTLHAEISGGAGATLRLEGSVTVGPIDIADGVTIDELTVALSTDGFAIDGIASVGVGEHVLHLAATGTVTDTQDWSLDVAALDTETWEPLPGLALTPNLSGSIARTDGEYAFAIQAGDPDGSPLVTWQPAAGASIAVQTIEISSAGAECAAVPDDPANEGDLVLGFAGAVSLSGTVVATDGCADLSIGAYHLQATASELSVTDDLLVTGLDLTADGAVGAGLELHGGGDATIAGHDVHVRFALATSGALVVGASVDLEAWGIPVQGFVAYASTDVDGFDTGDPTVGDDGVIDLEPGLTAAALWTPDTEANELLSTPAPDGLGLTAGGAVRFSAHIGAGSLVFTGEIEAPEGLPFLTLPGGTTIDEATLTFTREGSENTLALHVAATVQATTAVTVDLVLGLSDGTFTGEVDVTDLQLFGRTDIALHGTIERSRNAAGVMAVQASVTGSVGSVDEPVEVAPSVSFTHLDLTLGTGGVAVAGDAVIAGRDGLTVDGRVYTKADATSGFGAGGWRLAVSTSTPSEWSPTEGVAFIADLSGTVEKTSSAAPVSFRLEAAGPDGGDLFTFTPSDAPVHLAVRRVAIANASPAPAACAARPGDVWLSIEGSLTATIGGRDGTATASGCFDLTSGAMSVAADLSDLSVDLGGGVRVRGPRFTVSRTASTPPPAPGTSRVKVTAEVAIDLDLLGTPFSSPAPGTASTRLTAQLSYSGSAVVVGVRANFGRYGLGGVGGDAYLFYASAPVTGFATGDPALSKIDPKTGATTAGKIDLVKGVNFAARLNLPGSVTDGLGKLGGGEGVDAPSGAVTAIGQIDTAARAFTFRVQFKSGIGGQELLRTDNGTRLTLDDGFLKFTVKSGQASFGLGIAGSLHLPPVETGGDETNVPLTGELSISSTGFQASLQLGTCGSPENAWRNAFGVDGLTVECAAIQGGISFAGVPSIGFFGKVTALPADVANAIGYVQGAPMQFAFNLNPMMLSISIGVKDSKDVALRPLKAFGKPDFIQVRYASLYIAPVAVTIGQQTFPAGFGIGFQASIAGVDMNILASVDPTTPSISMLAEVSEIELGALKLGPVKVDLLASPTEFHFVVDGTLSLGPGTTDIGPALKVGGDLSVTVHVSILPGGFEAYVSGHASMQISALVPQEMCWYAGQIPIPCSFQWSATGFDVTLVKTGFAIDGKGISLIAGGYRITMLWEGGLTASSATSIEARMEQARLEAELRKQAGTAGAPVGSLAIAAADPVPEEEDHLEVVTPEASDEPMATAPLPDELLVSASRLIAGTSIMAPPAGPNPAGDMPLLDSTTDIVIDPLPVPLLAEGVAPGAWTATGELGDARTSAAMVSLPDGRVLVAGGAGRNGALASAEIYDPSTGRWTPTAPLATARSGASVAVLPGGRVLVAGGSDAVDGAPGAHALSSTEIYDAATGRWSAGPALVEARTHATTTVLVDGSVLVAGGLGPDGSLASAERFDPSGGGWHAVGPLATARGLASASRLADGRVLVAGGLGTTAPVAAAEVFDPGTETWRTVADMPGASMLDTATTLADGRVLVAGSDSRGKVYDPVADSWSWTGALGTVRAQATAVTLPDGDVLLIGGTAAGQVATDAEIYDAATNTWQATTALPTGTASATAVVLPDGSVLAVGGADRTTPLAAAAIYRAVTVPVAPAGSVPASATTGRLPTTGTDVLPIALAAVLLLAAGSAAVATARRRRDGRR